MKISISRDGEEIGEWTVEEVQALLDEGKILPTDCYWTHGMTEWQELATSIKPPPPAPSTGISQERQTMPSTTKMLPTVEDKPIVQPSVPPYLKGKSPFQDEDDEKKVGWISWTVCLIATANFFAAAILGLKNILGFIAIVVIVKLIARQVSKFARINRRRAIVYTVNTLYIPVVLYGAYMAFFQQIKGPVLVTPSLKQELLMESAVENKNTPRMVDANTRFEGTKVFCVNDDYIFRYTFTIIGATVDADGLKAYMLPKLKKEYIDHPEMQKFRDRGVTFEYHYLSETGTTVTYIIIKPDDFK